jgi:hypothetical protein
MYRKRVEIVPDSLQLKGFMTIRHHCDILRKIGVQAVDLYEKKLSDNQGNASKVDDLSCEGRVAFILQSHGFKITMRESPDLDGFLDSSYFRIEVKHCRWKKDHDPVVDALLAANHGRMVRTPKLMETEGYEEESEQMYRFAKKNAPGEFNVLFFVSDTEAQDEL